MKEDWGWSSGREQICAQCCTLISCNRKSGPAIKARAWTASKGVEGKGRRQVVKPFSHSSLVGLAAEPDELYSIRDQSS